MRAARAALRRCRQAAAAPAWHDGAPCATRVWPAAPQAEPAALVAAAQLCRGAQRRALHAQAADAAAPAEPERDEATAPGPMGVYGRGVASGKYRADAQQARAAGVRARAGCEREITCRRVTQGVARAQLEAIRKLQRVWEDVEGCPDRASAAESGSGLTLVDAVGQPAAWSLWDLISQVAKSAPLPPIRGLYLYGQPARPAGRAVPRSCADARC
jgi:hypothetical protein